MIKVAVIGYGYWGPRIARNFNSAPDCKVVTICDKGAASLLRAARDFPDIQITSDCDAVLASTAVDAVAIVTPVFTHFELAKAALNHGKHIFVEKPFTATSQQAEELIN